MPADDMRPPSLRAAHRSSPVRRSAAMNASGAAQPGVAAPPRAARPPAPAPGTRTVAAYTPRQPRQLTRSSSDPQPRPGLDNSGRSESSSSVNTTGSSSHSSKRARALGAVSSLTSPVSSSSSRYLGGTAGITSKARSALSTAGSLVASAASQAASTAAYASGASSSSEKPLSWGEWARDWGSGRRATAKGKEVLNLLPGWAVKRPRKNDTAGGFDLHVSTTGFCSFVRDPSNATRTQRALMGIAKRFAALPAMPVESQMSSIMQEELTDAPSRIDEENPDDFPVEPLRSRPSSSTLASSGATDPRPPSRQTSDLVFNDPEQLTLAHQYLDYRLRPFWSSVLPFRRVALSLYTIPLKEGDPPRGQPDAELLKQEPLMRTTFTTNAQGHFAHHFVIPWERIASHPQSVPMAFEEDPANDRTNWGLLVHAELLSEEGPDSLRRATGNPDAFVERDGKAVPRRVQSATSFFSSAEIPNRNDGDGDEEMGLMGLGKTMVQSNVVVGISRPGGIRVISDLDDTVKHSDILSGPREVFRNVFCRRLEDISVRGMSELYQELHKAGLSGLHFVSNSPFELFPIVADFLQLHKFPAYYSLKLKFYGGRSIVTSLFEPAGERKRPSILEILDEFDDSRFMLIGDSGEQDLELYSAIACERPHQIAAIFIRDVTSGRAEDLRNLVSGMSKMGLNSGSSSSGGSAPSSVPNSGASTPTKPASANSSTDDVQRTMAELQEMSAAEQKLLRRAAEWETRVVKAVATVPDTVPLVFFKEPEEIESVATGLVRDAQPDIRPAKDLRASAYKHERSA